jgi:PDZ domain
MTQHAFFTKYSPPLRSTSGILLGDFSHTEESGNLSSQDSPVVSPERKPREMNLEEYDVLLSPDASYGLGLNLDSIKNAKNDFSIIIIGFKSHPITHDPLPAEESGLIHVNDELLSINGTSLRG